MEFSGLVANYDIFRRYKPQLDSRRFQQTVDSFRGELSHALTAISPRNQEIQEVDAHHIAPYPPQNSRVTVVESATNSKSSQSVATPAYQKCLPCRRSTVHAVKPTRSFHRHQKRELLRRLTVIRQRRPRHHVLFHRFDHREYDRDVHRGIRGRRLRSHTELDSFSGSSSSSSFSPSDDSHSNSLQMLDRQDNLAAPITGYPYQYSKSQMNCVAEYLRNRATKYMSPKDTFRDTVVHAIRHYYQTHFRHERQLRRQEINCPNDLLELIWRYRKFWPLYRLKSKFGILKGSQRFQQSHLRIRGRAIPHRGCLDDPLHHRYGTLLAAQSRTICGDTEKLQNFANHSDRIADYLPALGRHTRSMTDIVTHLLHSDNRFAYLYDGSASPRVLVANASIPLNGKFIRNSLTLLQNERFSEFTGDPDSLAITAVKVISHSLDHGLIAALNTLESDPVSVLGRDWHDRFIGKQDTAKRQTNSDMMLHSGTELMEDISEVPRNNIEHTATSDNARTSKSLERSREDMPATPKVVSSRTINLQPESPHFSSEALTTDRAGDVSSSKAENHEELEGRPEDRLTGSKSATTADVTVKRLHIERQQFLDIKQEILMKQKVRRLNRILVMVKQNQAFAKICERRVLLNLRHRAQMAAHARRAQYAASPGALAYQIHPKHVPGKKRHKKNNIRKRKPAKEHRQLRSRAEMAVAKKRQHESHKTFRKARLFQSVLLTRKGRVVLPVPVATVNRTMMLVRRNERLRKRFNHPVSKSRDKSPVKTSDQLNADLDDEPTMISAWRGIASQFHVCSYDAQVLANRATFEKERAPLLTAKDTALSLAIGDELTLDQKGRIHLQRARSYLKMGCNYYDYALGEIRTSVAFMGYTMESALLLACFCYYKKQIFRSLSYFVLAAQITPVTNQNNTLWFKMQRAMALLLFHTHQYTLALSVWIDASAAAGVPDSLFFLFAGICYRRLGDERKADCHLRTFLEMADSSREHVICSVYCRALLDEHEEAKRKIERIQSVELFFNAKLMMFCARMFWTTRRFTKSLECLTQCRLVRRFVRPAHRGIDCSDKTVTFLEILVNIQLQNYRAAYQLSQNGRLRWPTDLRFMTWWTIIKFQTNINWRQKPWATSMMRKLTNRFPENHFVWYAEARCGFYSERDPRRALRCLMRAIQIAPKFYEAYFFRCTLRTSLRSYKGAIDDARLCCDVFPRRALCWATYGYLALLIHRYQTALACFLLTLKLKRQLKFNWVFLIRGWTFFKWEYYEQAYEDFIMLLRQSPKNSYLLKATALAAWHLKGQKFVSAFLKSYKQVLPVSPTVWVLYGLSLFVQSKRSSYTEAVHVLQQVIRTHPLHRLARFNLGVALHWCRQPDDAVIMFDSLHNTEQHTSSNNKEQTDELRIHAYAGLGISLFLISQHARSLGILESIANTGLADAYFYVAFGYVRMAMKKPREAETAFRKACNLEKHNREVPFIIAAIYMLYSCVKKAVGYYSKLVDCDDVRYVCLALLNRAFALSNLEEYQLAMADVKRLISCHPEFAVEYHVQIEALF